MIADMSMLPAEIAGQVQAHPATDADTVAGVAPAWVVEPASDEQIAAVLRAAGAHGLRLAPRGGGSKMGWGNSPRALDGVLSTLRLDRVLEHAWDDMTATVQAGCPVAVFQSRLAEHGQRLALDPLWPERATIGGILATNDSGALRLRFGALRDQVIGMTVALPDGTVARSGGKVVKNVAGYDLPKLFTGSLGTLGVITEATFRLYPLPASVRTITVRAQAVAPLHRLVLRILDSTLVPTGLQLRAGSDTPELDVRWEGNPAVEAQTDGLYRLMRDTGELAGSEIADDARWQARQALWEGCEQAALAKISVLPTDLGRLCEVIRQIAVPGDLGWRLVVQAIGIGALRLEGPPEAAMAALLRLRAEVEDWGGSLVVLHRPPQTDIRFDAWGTVGDSLPLMRRLKEQFDPLGTLNPGRFVDEL